MIFHIAFNWPIFSFICENLLFSLPFHSHVGLLGSPKVYNIYYYNFPQKKNYYNSKKITTDSFAISMKS